jgi:hypothetical protein
MDEKLNRYALVLPVFTLALGLMACEPAGSGEDDESTGGFDMQGDPHVDDDPTPPPGDSDDPNTDDPSTDDGSDPVPDPTPVGDETGTSSSESGTDPSADEESTDESTDEASDATEAGDDEDEAESTEESSESSETGESEAETGEDDTEESGETGESDESGDTSTGEDPDPVCGDGKVDQGEECDDGNDDETDDCVGCRQCNTLVNECHAAFECSCNRGDAGKTCGSSTFGCCDVDGRVYLGMECKVQCDAERVLHNHACEKICGQLPSDHADELAECEAVSYEKAVSCIQNLDDTASCQDPAFCHSAAREAYWAYCQFADTIGDPDVDECMGVELCEREQQGSAGACNDDCDARELNECDDSVCKAACLAGRYSNHEGCSVDTTCRTQGVHDLAACKQTCYATERDCMSQVETDTCEDDGYACVTARSSCLSAC